VQTFGHVGVLYCWHDAIFYDTVESGQGGSGSGLDSMKWTADVRRQNQRVMPRRNVALAAIMVRS
jgi:hypothetical protein